MWWITGAVLLVGLTIAAAVAFVSRRAPGAAAPARFVGGESCIACHRDQHEQWRSSHHDLAMMAGTPETGGVLGDFDDATFTDAGVTSRFSKLGNTYEVHTEGPDGKLGHFPIRYTFGVDPLQQYLVELGGGRLQSLTVAWDVKNHRWFSLYPGRNIAPDDWLHWTKRGQNWNSNCAECHSTNLQKNYDLATDTYKTTWSEINVSCEQCHGPASRHVEWANAWGLKRWWGGYDESKKGLVLKLKDENRAWGFNAEGQPALVGSSNPDPQVQVEMCAQCHSRRGPVSVEHLHGDDFLDHYMPQLLQENIYHPDGQILDEVYEYGSFVQSKMYHKGVRCTDCHNPHSGRTLAPAAGPGGNLLCVRCHVPAKYDTPLHHFHQPTSTGASCVECHMPSRTYMVVDPRRDHSLRVPRPDLSVKLGTPNACTQCHADKPPEWAAEAVEKWYGPKRRDDPHYGPIFAAAWAGKPEAGSGLRELLLDAERPGFIRASAATALQGYYSQQTIDAAIKALRDPDPLVRSMSAALLGPLPPTERVTLLAPLLGDPVRAVRHIAARSLLTVPRDLLTGAQKESFDAAIKDQTAAMIAHSDNVAGRMALGGLYQDLGQPDKAIAAYQVAVTMDRQNLDAQMALAELYIRMGRDQDAESLLTRMLELDRPPELPQRMWDRARGTVQYQLGLLVASNPARLKEGLHHVTLASELLPKFARLYYNLAELHRSVGEPREAERAYLKALELEPTDADALYALAVFYAQQQRWPEAQAMAARLAEQRPNDPAARQLVEQLRAASAAEP